MDNQQEGMDKITLDTALGWRSWMLVWAAEPLRKISVEMTYNDLVKIVNLIKEA